MQKGESKVLQYFGNLFILFFKLQQKQPSIRSKGPHVTPSEATILSVLWSPADISSTHLLKLLPLLGCWSIRSAESEPWIRTSNNLRVLGPDYMLDEVTFLTVLWSHADTNPCPFRWRASSLKPPPPLGCLSVVNTRNELWMGISKILLT